MRRAKVIASFGLLALLLRLRSASAQPQGVSGCPGSDQNNVCTGSGDDRDYGLVAGGVVRMKIMRSGAVTFPGALSVTLPAVLGQVLHADGTVALPSDAFTSEPTLGFYRSATGVLAVANGNAGGNPAYLFAPSFVSLGSSQSINWSSTTAAANVAETQLARGGGAGKVVLTGTTPTFMLGGTTASFPAFQASGTAVLVQLADGSARAPIFAADMHCSTCIVTAGSGTGVTVNEAGTIEQNVYKVTVASTAFTCAAVTCDVTVATLPAKTFVTHTIADLTQTFACSATCTTATLSATLGKTAGGTQYLLSFDTDAATGQFGDAAAELGASLAPATMPAGIGDVAAWSGTTAVVLRMTSGTGNIGTGAATNFSQGSMTFYITTVRMP